MSAPVLHRRTMEISYPLLGIGPRGRGFLSVTPLLLFISPGAWGSGLEGLCSPQLPLRFFSSSPWLRRAAARGEGKGSGKMWGAVYLSPFPKYSL